VWQHCKVVTLYDATKMIIKQALFSRSCWQLEPNVGGSQIGSGSVVWMLLCNGFVNIANITNTSAAMGRKEKSTYLHVSIFISYGLGLL